MSRPEILPSYLRASDESWMDRYLARLDWSLVGAVVVLAVFGLLFIYSATGYGGHAHVYLTRQAAALVVGLALMAVLAFFPYQIFLTYWRWVFAASLVALVLVLVFGVRLRGSRSWFSFHWFNFQPVEATRLALAVALAAYADLRSREILEWPGLLPPLFLTGLHLGLILLQPDLSSALVLVPMTFAVLFASGGSLPFLLALAGLGSIALGVPLASTYFALMGDKADGGWIAGWLRRAFLEPAFFAQLVGVVCGLLCLGWWFLRRWRVFVPAIYLAGALAVVLAGVGGSFVVKKAIKEYQRKRLIAFVEPGLDPLGAGYNILQSEIALGSGRFFGKGYLSGSQSQLGFLPERHTDFIFSTVAEEMGFFRSLFVLGVYFWIVWRAFDIAGAARDRFGRYLAVALGTLFGFAGLVNIGMAMGLMPVTGLPLPFLSYGGSAMVGACAGVGLLLSIHLRRYIM